MNRRNLYISFAILASSFACTPKTYNSMIKAESKIEIDGERNEWGNPLRYFDSKSKLFYEVRSDKQNLYIAFSANEKATIMRAMQRGIQLSIDTAMGKDDYPSSITFPCRPGPEFGGDSIRPHMMKRDSLNPPRFTENDSEHPRFHKHKSKIKIMGFDGDKTETLDSKNNKYGIEAAMKGNHQDFFSEIKIPFSQFYRKTNIDSIKPLFFEVNLEAAERGDMQFPAGNPDEMPKGDRAEMRGGAPHGGMGGGNGMHDGPPPGGMGGGPGGGPGGMPPMQGGESKTPNIFRFQLKPRF